MGAKRGKMLKQVTTSFDLASDWLRKWHEFVSQSQSVVVHDESSHMI